MVLVEADCGALEQDAAGQLHPRDVRMRVGSRVLARHIHLCICSLIIDWLRARACVRASERTCVRACVHEFSLAIGQNQVGIRN